MIKNNNNLITEIDLNNLRKEGQSKTDIFNKIKEQNLYEDRIEYQSEYIQNKSINEFLEENPTIAENVIKFFTHKTSPITAAYLQNAMNNDNTLLEFFQELLEESNLFNNAFNVAKVFIFHGTAIKQALSENGVDYLSSNLAIDLVEKEIDELRALDDALKELKSTIADEEKLIRAKIKDKKAEIIEKIDEQYGQIIAFQHKGINLYEKTQYQVDNLAPSYNIPFSKLKQFIGQKEFTKFLSENNIEIVRTPEISIYKK